MENNNTRMDGNGLHQDLDCHCSGRNLLVKIYSRLKEEQKKNLERAQICNWKWLASNKSFNIYVSKNIYGKILFNGLY